jgi:hypothetical protein
MDAIPSCAELSTTTSTGTYHNYDIIESNQVITYAYSTTGIDNIKGETAFAIYNKHIDVTTNNTSYTTTGRLDETLRATIWVFVKYWSFNAHLHRQRRLEGCLHYRVLIAQRRIIERDIEDRETNVEFPSVILQSDFPAAPDDGGAEAEEVFW